MYLRNVISLLHQASELEKQSKTHGSNSTPLLTSCGGPYCTTIAAEFDWLPLHSEGIEGSVLLKPLTKKVLKTLLHTYMGQIEILYFL